VLTIVSEKRSCQTTGAEVESVECVKGVCYISRIARDAEQVSILGSMPASKTIYVYQACGVHDGFCELCRTAVEDVSFAERYLYPS